MASEDTIPTITIQRLANGKFVADYPEGRQLGYPVRLVALAADGSVQSDRIIASPPPSEDTPMSPEEEQAIRDKLHALYDQDPEKYERTVRGLKKIGMPAHLLEPPVGDPT